MTVAGVAAARSGRGGGGGCSPWRGACRRRWACWRAAAATSADALQPPPPPPPLLCCCAAAATGVAVRLSLLPPPPAGRTVPATPPPGPLPLPLSASSAPTSIGSCRRWSLSRMRVSALAAARVSSAATVALGRPLGYVACSPFTSMTTSPVRIVPSAAAGPPGRTALTRLALLRASPRLPPRRSSCSVACTVILRLGVCAAAVVVAARAAGARAVDAGGAGAGPAGAIRRTIDPSGSPSGSSVSSSESCNGGPAAIACLLADGATTGGVTTGGVAGGGPAGAAAAVAMVITWENQKGREMCI